MEVVSSLAAPLQQLAAAGSLEVEVVEVVSSLAARLEQVVAAGSLQVEVVEVVSSPPLAAQVGVLSAESTLARLPRRARFAPAGTLAHSSGRHLFHPAKRLA